MKDEGLNPSSDMERERDRERQKDMHPWSVFGNLWKDKTLSIHWGIDPKPQAGSWSKAMG